MPPEARISETRESASALAVAVVDEDGCAGGGESAGGGSADAAGGAGDEGDFVREFWHGRSSFVRKTIAGIQMRCEEYKAQGCD